MVHSQSVLHNAALKVDALKNMTSYEEFGIIEKYYSQAVLPIKADESIIFDLTNGQCFSKTYPLKNKQPILFLF